MRKLLYIILFLPAFSFGQNDTVTIIKTKEPADIFSAGLGYGQDLGGIGVNLTYYATNKIGFQGGLGYANPGIGYNVGVKYRFLKEESLSHRTPFFIAMYGYTAALKVKDSSNLNKVFIGPSLGFGIDSKAMGLSHTYWSFAVFYPFIGNDIQKYISINHISLSKSATPFTISISYKVIIR